MTKKTLEEYQIQEIARTVFLEGASDFVRRGVDKIQRLSFDVVCYNKSMRKTQKKVNDERRN